MGKVIKINGAGAKEESLKEISENLHMLKRTLVGVVAEYEENEAEEKVEKMAGRKEKGEGTNI